MFTKSSASQFKHTFRVVFNDTSMIAPEGSTNRSIVSLHVPADMPRKHVCVMSSTNHISFLTDSWMNHNGTEVIHESNLWKHLHQLFISL